MIQRPDYLIEADVQSIMVNPWTIATTTTLPDTGLKYADIYSNGSIRRRV